MFTSQGPIGTGAFFARVDYSFLALFRWKSETLGGFAMFGSFRNVFLLALSAGLTWGCGGERVTTSHVPEAGDGTGQPLGKLALNGMARAVVVARVQEGETPVSGVTVEFSRSVSGRAADFKWSGTTDAQGLARVEIEGTGYYRARAMMDGNVLGSWSSIPINGDYDVMLDLPIGESARVASSSVRGVVTIGEGEAVQIRTLLSHTVVPGLADASRYSIELAVQDFGAIHGHEIELGAAIDAMCSAEGGRLGAEQILNDLRVLGVIGTNCSGSAVAASPLLSEAGLAMVSPSNTSPALTSDLAGNASPNYHPGYFRTSNNDLYEANAVADFAYSELGLRRFVTIDDGDPYTMGLTVAFGNAFSALGGEVAVAARIEKGVTDMADILAEFAEAGPDGIFFPLFDIEGAPFAEQAMEFEGLENATLITSSALLLTKFLPLPESEGIYFAGPEPVEGSNVNEATGKSADEVLAAYAAAYGGIPNTVYWAHSYDAATLLLSAIVSSASVDGGNVSINRNALRKVLHTASGFQGLLGTLTCDEFGDCGTGRINIYHHTDTSITDPAQLTVVYRFVP
jgi:branched-chain amino acid transport system substrate-binding protein